MNSFFPLHERLKALTRPDFGKLTQRFENALLLQNQTFKNPKLITCYLSPRKFHCSFFIRNGSCLQFVLQMPMHDIHMLKDRYFLTRNNSCCSHIFTFYTKFLTKKSKTMKYLVFYRIKCFRFSAIYQEVSIF